MSAPLLRLEDVAIDVRGREVVSRAVATLGQGECLGLVGETGCGKTMTCRALTGTLGRIGGRVTSGKIDFEGLDLARLPEREWRRVRGRRIALVPQSAQSALNPLMKAGEHLVELIRHLEGTSRGAAKQRALELLAQVQLHDPDVAFASYAHQLSGGMRQRIMIALAIASRPKLLIADEATTALDVTVQRGILDLVTSLRRETGMSVILVTHDLSVVESYSDKTAVMYAGMTVESGPTHEVLATPLHPYTRALLAARPAHRMSGDRLAGIPGSAPSPAGFPPGCRFAPRCAYAQATCERAAPPLEEMQGRSVACYRTREISHARLTSLSSRS